MGFTSIIKKRLGPDEWLSMEQYMELALYHPVYGYYMNKQKKIGKNGDFYTASSVSDVFGKVWADVFVRMILEHSLDPIVIEFGGGSGKFAKHVMTSWKEHPNAHDVKYVIVEKSPYHRELLGEELKGLPVTIYSSFEELQQMYPSFNGIVFANEILDAFPVRIFLNKENSWFEKVVIYDKETDDLSFQLIRNQDKRLEKLFDEKFAKRPKGFECEFSFQMLEWLKEIYQWAKEGTIFFFVDYGYKGEEWNMNGLREGTIRGYYRHQMEYNPLSHPGEMDITSHVDWDQVRAAGSSNHVETIALNTQGDFLLREGLLAHLSDSHARDPFSKEHKRNRAIRSFLLDGTLANGFQVIQQKKRSVQ